MPKGHAKFCLFSRTPRTPPPPLQNPHRFCSLCASHTGLEARIAVLDDAQLAGPSPAPRTGQGQAGQDSSGGRGRSFGDGGGARPPEPPTSPPLQVPPLGARPGPCPGPRPLAPRPATSPPFLGGSAPRGAGALWRSPSSVLKDCSGSRKRAGGGSRRWWGGGGGPGLCLPPHLPLTTQLCPALLKVLS